ncbi:MAG: CCA tRNA nucleotidyltransferase [Deltaproteobacteria bacterium]
MAYLVGGCVRDLLLGRIPKDFDIATSARPNEVKTIFRNCRVIGRRFRLAHILFGGGKILEVATFRRDPGLTGEDWEEPGAAPAVEEGAPPATPALRRPMKAVKQRDDDADLLIRHDNVFGEPPEDAARRDFTMNALFYDLERQEIVDYVGGLAEIERRVIRTIGEPDVRFREDPVRILRAIKFAARLDLGLEPDVYDAMVTHRDDLLRAARPRLLEEILRFLRGGAARRSFWLAWETGVLAVLLPELAAFLDDDAEGNSRLWDRLARIDAQVARGDVPSDAVLFSTLLLEPVDEAIEGERDAAIAVADYLAEPVTRLAIPRRLTDRMRQILAIQRRLRSGRIGSLARREYYAESAQVYAFDARTRGVPAHEIEAILAGREPSAPKPPTPRRPTRPPRPSGPVVANTTATTSASPGGGGSDDAQQRLDLTPR